MLNQKISNSTGSFDDLGIAPKLMQILKSHKFVTPTPIQKQSIPAALSGSDIMGIAQTGTGKTLAFGVPMIQRLVQHKGTGLVVLPTRELALQVNETLKKIGSSIGLKTAILIGGENIGRQISALKRGAHIIIATPGRLIDHIEQKTVDLSQTHVLVLDEADRMLDMGFAPQIKKILEKVPKTRQTLLFSATMPDEIVKIANSYMRTPIRIEVAPAGSAVQSVTQEIYFLDRGQKLSLLKKLLHEYNGSVLVFSRTKYGAKKIARDIRNMKITSTEIHSNRSLNQRLEALNGFKLGKYRVMVATDIAARGIDVTGIQLVINYDLPDQAEDYVHRIGRTGRAAMTGHAISFATHDQKRDVKIIERLIRKALPVAELPTLEKVVSATPPRSDRPERDDRRSSRNERSDRSRRPEREPRKPVTRPSRAGASSRPSSRPSSHSRPGDVPSTRRVSRGPGSQRNSGPRSSNPRGGAKRSNRKWTEYERGRKPAPQSLKRISQSSSGFFMSNRNFGDDE